ncbi:MAG: Phosphoribosylformylglycinamidine (FGAM) synthase PurS component [Candidatus Methanohalarchaeum thermophilum]|uniref:Phosphoribosylformylglycinamidine synthase subunit PurS n=1 Tax=Methanohalarchaeum thermophilum TaxID=1903181 RepID=A0A1Q6DTM2_METT1|nr:MAG: Phosphoribosylformylglycinamidine (FGAM) synthase PurS component [Candidatus Methanohalarchaeum thermophilum]
MLDPEGKAIKKSLQKVGFEDVEDARVGKQIKLRLKAESKEEVRSEVDKMCKKILANPVIHQYNIKVEGI